MKNRQLTYYTQTTKRAIGLSALFLASSLCFSGYVSAANTSTNTSQPQAMEKITITYRNAFDYALYVQTTEMLVSFNRELEQKNVIEARNQTHDMAADFGVLVSQHHDLLEQTYDNNKSVQSLGVLVAPE
ncbi:hypothetical protein [Shewanella aestuarii]|uniref:Uncharacterized protein n=1 Tax=Shewanella aestuarii TaxID=1028752 RepID=A0A6G9QLJ9_9GAMM|nr:hypothetical protein [Shewanella aestuarii]QIR15464.1 hypothetical protein HBH39_13965 [Shewanella aestuarii]